MGIGAALDHVHDSDTRIYVREETSASCNVCGLDGGVFSFDVVYYVFENDYDAAPCGERKAYFCAHVDCWKMACAGRLK